MHFYCVTWYEYRHRQRAALPEYTIFPCVLLISNSWNDYGYVTSYNMVYFNSKNDTGYEFVSSVKILQRESLDTIIPDSFERLNNNFCSLGQSLEYYESLYKLGKPLYKSILNGLRDVVYNSQIANEFESLEGFQKSLLRFSEAEKAYKEAASIFPELEHKQITDNKFIFKFECRIGKAQNNHAIEFNFSSDKTKLSRIIAIIGKNGTGKTQVLANFARALSGLSESSGTFSPERPSFSKVISISYSVFDEFSRPYDDIEQELADIEEQLAQLEGSLERSKTYLPRLNEQLKKFKKLQGRNNKLLKTIQIELTPTNQNERDQTQQLMDDVVELINQIEGSIKDVDSDIALYKTEIKDLAAKQTVLREQIGKLDEKKNFFSYVYCGIRKQQQLLTQQEIKDKLFSAFKIVQELNRTSDWLEVMTTLLQDIVDPKRIKGISRKGVTSQFYDSLSSGQRILVLVLTEVIAYIEKESMIMFDEPELHLHPEAISALTRAIHLLLEKFKSYAIIATHSPIIIQEIPAKYIRIFRRRDNFVFVDPLLIESFGENITAITEQIFETSGKNNNYKGHLKDLLANHTYEEILDLFDNQLSFNARAALSSLDKNFDEFPQ